MPETTKLTTLSCQKWQLIFQGTDCLPFTRKFDEQGNAYLVMEEYQVVLDKPMFREK